MTQRPGCGQEYRFSIKLFPVSEVQSSLTCDGNDRTYILGPL